MRFKNSMRIRTGVGVVCLLLTVCALALSATFGMHRHHVVTKAQPLHLVPSTETPSTPSMYSVALAQIYRRIQSNGIPKHLVGRFPNPGNPNAIAQQRYVLDLPAHPTPADKITSINLEGRFGPPSMPFGIAVNGVLFDPGTAEFWHGDTRSGWNYDALGGAVPLGIDDNYAHVQPQGAYHYHGIPQRLLEALGFDASKHSPLVGWAADGFPIYCAYGYLVPDDPGSRIVPLKSSFQLKPGNRPGDGDGPGGAYDGTFVEDYVYVAGAGDLDECNGRTCKTPDFPDGTYAYFLTQEWPVIPRAFRGTPVRLR